MRRFIRNRVSEEELAPPAAPPDFKEVFLTGATGFVGRFLLRDLLQQDKSRVVHCLVRAADADHGLERVRGAMQQAGIWDESFEPRLRVWVGDLVENRFGLAHSDFAGLCQQIDAVYHVAAKVALAASYANVRATNVEGLRSVLDLCLSLRFKHLFFISTLGLFPQYFCGFAEEFRDSRIEVQMQPNPDSMKQVFPLGLSGYPWTKLTAEQILLLAQRAGLPLAIFRLSQTATSTTGFAKADDVMARLFAAMADVEARPHGAVFEWNTEPADVHSKVVTDISLNPHRQYTIYHCCNPSLLYSELGPADFGFYHREVSYAAFKRLCLAKGARSPLHRLWPLFDRFAPYWFSQREPKDSQPICDRAIREDCPNPIQWPGLLTLLRRTDDWMRSHPDEWPHPRPESRLDFDCLMLQGDRYTRRLATTPDAAFPDWLLTGLHQLVAALQAPEAQITEAARTGVVLELSRALSNNARLAAERIQHPGIAETDIVQPVFIVGMHRTGTTLLHRVLSRDPRFRVLRAFETVQAAEVRAEHDGIAGTPADPRVQYLEDSLQASGIVKLFSDLHHIDPNEPEEEIALLRMSFHSWNNVVRYHVPSYACWLGDVDMSVAYRHHHRGNLQRHAYVDRLQQGHPRQWLLKMPFHLMELDALIQTYPDALFIQTHRAPRQFMGSWNSLVERVRTLVMEPLSAHEQGREHLALMSGMMDRAMDFRLAHPELEHRWLDLSYYDLVQDPLAIADIVYDHFHWNLEPRVVAAMDDWLIQQSRRRRSEQRHRYELADYGLAPDDVDQAFARYRDFIADRGIHQPRL
ncbi:MAG: SDR family oxidoreductase [Caldilineaceae bacterium]|nr:SDR family oxidoreductase [Caldilineaceae bacterium]